jgi:RNA polymerase sigma factor (sigma-70 family)
METNASTAGASDSLPDRIRAGEESAFEEFRVRYTASFYYYFRRRGLPETAAMDLAASCITDFALKVRDGFNPEHTSFGAWVNLLRRHAAVDWWRRERRLKTAELDPQIADWKVDAWSEIDDEAERESDEIVAVAEAVAKLDPIDRELLLRRYGGQLQPSFGEIAKDLPSHNGHEWKEATLRQRHARALSRLKEQLGHDPRLAHVLEKADAT